MCVTPLLQIFCFLYFCIRDIVKMEDNITTDYSGKWKIDVMFEDTQMNKMLPEFDARQEVETFIIYWLKAFAKVKMNSSIICSKANQYFEIISKTNQFPKKTHGYRKEQIWIATSFALWYKRMFGQNKRGPKPAISLLLTSNICDIPNLRKQLKPLVSNHIRKVKQYCKNKSIEQNVILLLPDDFKTYFDGERIPKFINIVFISARSLNVNNQSVGWSFIVKYIENLSQMMLDSTSDNISEVFDIKQAIKIIVSTWKQMLQFNQSTSQTFIAHSIMKIIEINKKFQLNPSISDIFFMVDSNILELNTIPKLMSTNLDMSTEMQSIIASDSSKSQISIKKELLSSAIHHLYQATYILTNDVFEGDWITRKKLNDVIRECRIEEKNLDFNLLSINRRQSNIPDNTIRPCAILLWSLLIACPRVEAFILMHK
ncbi:hypothetical protein BLOT_003979 [Blomia tropicalis]|nr:hypothetical protein BLOT_003979 [Blomia tropicalis]